LTNASGCVIRHVQHLVAKVPVALIVGATEPPLDDLPLPLPGRTVRRDEVDASGVNSDSMSAGALLLHAAR
jgi:hypothetical protein